MSLTECTAIEQSFGPSAGPFSPALFAVDVEALEDELVLTLHGELDLWTQPSLARALENIDEHVRRVTVDLAGVTFIDAGNIGNILRAQERARLRGSELVLRSPSPHLSRVLELIGLTPSTPAAAEARHALVLPLPSRAYDRPMAPALGAGD